MTAWVSDLHNSQDNRETESRGPREREREGGSGEARASAQKTRWKRRREGETTPQRFIMACMHIEKEEEKKKGIVAAGWTNGDRWTGIGTVVPKLC